MAWVVGNYYSLYYDELMTYSKYNRGEIHMLILYSKYAGLTTTEIERTALLSGRYSARYGSVIYACMAGCALSIHSGLSVTIVTFQIAPFLLNHRQS